MNGENDPNAFNLQMMQQGMQPGTLGGLQAQLPMAMQQNVQPQPGMPVQFVNLTQMQRHPQMMTEDQSYQNYIRLSQNLQSSMTHNMQQSQAINVPQNVRQHPGNVVFVTNQPQRQNTFYVNNGPQMLPSNLQPMMTQMRMRPQMQQFSQMPQFQMRQNVPQMVRQSPVFMIPQPIQQAQSPYIPQFYQQNIEPQQEVVNFIQPSFYPSQQGLLREQQHQHNYPIQFINQPAGTFMQSQLPNVRQLTSASSGFERSSSQPQVPQTQHISRPISDVSKPSIIHYKPQVQVEKSPQNIDNYQEPIIQKAVSNENFLMPPAVQINSPPLVAPAQGVDIFSTPTTIRLCNSIPTCDSGPAITILENAIKNLKSDKQIISSIPESTFVEVVVTKYSRDANFHNKQRFVIKESVFESIYARDHIEFQVKCVDENNTINNWPKVFSLVINGKLLSAPLKDEITGDESILIKNYIKKEENLLEITCFVPADSSMSEGDIPKFAFKFLINLVLRSTMSVMCRALVHKRTQSVRKAIEFVQNFFVTNQLEMARGYTLVSLHDPVTRDQIVLPVRGENCKHIQCFDFEAFFSRHTNRTHFICPVCGIVGAIPGIIVDGFMCTLVNQFRNCQEVSDVKITPECNWSLASNKEEESLSQASNRPPSEASNFAVDENYLSHEQLLNIFGDDKREALINFFNQANVKFPEIINKTESPSKSSKKSPNHENNSIELTGITKRSFSVSENEKSSLADLNKSDSRSSPPLVESFDKKSPPFICLFKDDDENFLTSKSSHQSNMQEIFKFGSDSLISQKNQDMSMGGLMRNSLDEKIDEKLNSTTWDPIDDDFLKEIDQSNTFDPGKK